jgi:hypothetical protein
MNSVEAGPTVFGRGHLESLGPKAVSQEIGDVRLVLDDHDVAHGFPQFAQTSWGR